MEFIDYIAGLAPEGETVLLVQQKPVRKDGEPVLHNDGTPKYVWPAFPPDHIIKPGSAFYANTGCFILDRFAGNKPSASAANCEYVLVMVLDDVGTKSKTPPIEPTWIMETSPGNYQWGYTFSEQPTKGEFAAAIKAVAEAGFTDKGAINAVRNFRIPGSVNLKAGKDFFESKLVEFHPEREFTLDQICNALGVVPGDADSATMRGVKLEDDGDDDILNFVADNGMLFERPNMSGWAGVLCPQADKHSDGNPMARYNPIHRSFCCYHSSCEGLDSRAYLEWLTTLGAPKHEPGIRSELLSEKMGEALAKIQPSDMFQATADEAIAEIEQKELGRMQKDDWYGRFAYIQDDDAYFDQVERREISRSTFNALYRHISCKSIHTGRRIEASVCFDENRDRRNAQALVGITYAPGDGVLLKRDGQLYGNRWRDARPDLSGVTPSDIEPWLAHCRELIPNDTELEHIFNVMAFKLQNPHIKINHAILHGGDEGSGKDTMWAPFIWSVCGANLRNRGIMDSDSVNSQWGYQLESEILLINELKEPDAATRRALANKLKPIIAAPPDMLPINRKGLHPYMMVNRTFVLAFSNDPVPISLPSQDRRWFCVWSQAPRMAADRAKAMWDWYHAGGFQAVALWLKNRDVSKFNPSETPMMTEFKMTLVEHGMSMAESFIVEMLRNRLGEFQRGMIGSPFHSVCDRLTGVAPSGTKIPQAALLHALKEAGWKDMGRIASTDFPNKKRIFCAPEIAETHSKSELRRMIETPIEAKNVVVNMQKKAA